MPTQSRSLNDPKHLRKKFESQARRDSLIDGAGKQKIELGTMKQLSPSAAAGLRQVRARRCPFQRT